MSLPRYTWDQAEVLGLYSAKAFPAWAIPAATVRRWAADGIIVARGIGPNNAKLYLAADVSRASSRERKTPGRKPKSHA